jgi:hypothetical protein
LDHYDTYVVPWYDLSKSYLESRYRAVLRESKGSVESIFSEWDKVKHGVPKRPILGPLHFIFYINHLPKIIIISCNPPLSANDQT